MESTMLIHYAFICPKVTLFTYLWPMEMDYAAWIYDWIPGMQSCLSNIEIWSRSIFDPVSETLSNAHVCGCPKYILDTNLQRPGVIFT